MTKYCKKILSVFVALCMLVSFNITNMTVYATDVTREYELPIGDPFIIAFYSVSNVIRTPNGTYVSAYRARIEIPDVCKAFYDQVSDEVSPSATRFTGATNDFNCHSYAFYSQDKENNTYWIDNPSVYYSDGSYTVTTTPNIGDVICYIDANGKNIHSGIVVGRSGEASNGLCGNANMYIVESKWGDYGIFRHNGYECPYTTYVDDSDDPNVDLPAVAVRFYRANYTLSGETAIHDTHSFTTYNDFNNLYYHESICECGLIIHQPHNWYESQVGARGLDYVPTYICYNCGMTTLQPPLGP